MWEVHRREHAQLALTLTDAERRLAEKVLSELTAHQREHTFSSAAHVKEHLSEAQARDKAEQAVDRRLEGMNEFRAQLDRQQASFVTREVFETANKEIGNRSDILHGSTTEKTEAVLRALASRHDSDVDVLRELIQTEREIRKSFEASVNTWKWIVSFFGASSIGGVILLFMTRAGG